MGARFDYINISGRPDAGLAWKCFPDINNVACLYLTRRASVVSVQLRPGVWGAGGAKGLVFIIKPPRQTHLTHGRLRVTEGAVVSGMNECLHAYGTLPG